MLYIELSLSRYEVLEEPGLDENVVVSLLPLLGNPIIYEKSVDEGSTSATFIAGRPEIHV